MMRWLGRVILALSCGSLWGCLPDVGAECTSDGECVGAGQSCIGGLCITRLGPDLDPGADAAPIDGQVDPPPDSAVVDTDGPIEGDAGPCVPTTESCDGVDNDCDGFTDEGADGVTLREPCYTGPEGTRGAGLCRGGERICVDGAFGECAGQVLPVDEVCAIGDRECRVCNGRDDDCDGRIDENLTRECGPEQVLGRCEPGVALCVFGSFGACEGAVFPFVEICDQQDNDCDGATDEETLGECECEAGDPGRDCYDGPPETEGVLPCRPGFQVCEGMTYGVCEDSIVPGVETCNQVNDDCDDNVDEGLGGQPCSQGLGACRRDGRTECRAEGMVCNAQEGAPSPERCNDIDDDCDGRTDEGFPVDSVCEVGLGRCRALGAFVCAENGRVECDAEEGDPQEETCNGVDDDCDGREDEGPDGADLTTPCYESPEGDALGERSGRGLCADGIRTCADGRFGACEGAVGPLPEACNNLDDDCDGVLDDVEGGCECQIGESQPCYEGPQNNAGVGACTRGMQACIAVDGGATGFGECEGSVLPGTEACNRIDDDCDGRTDEGTYGDCTVGNGLCVAEGRNECRNGREICDATAGMPVDEICDGLDNDCDGDTDEALIGDPCVVGEGLCAAPGQEVCVDAAWVCMGEPGDPAPEVCNGADDDCNGTVDDIAEEGCEVGVGACAARGVFACAGEERVCVGDEGSPGAEVCNGIDDDCNGEVDDIVAARCEVEGPCGGEGVFECVDDEQVCVVEPNDAPEVCDGRDNDCDGTADEDAEALCPAAPNATGRCRVGACLVECEPTWVDDNEDLEDGCERGGGDPVDGQVIAGQIASGVAGLMAIAARPGTDDVLIVWRDTDGQLMMSRDGGAAEVLFPVVPEELGQPVSLRVIGLAGGFTVLQVNEVAPGAYGVAAGDLEADGDELARPMVPAVAGPFGAIPTITAAPGGFDGTALVWVEPAPGMSVGPRHIRSMTRALGEADFGDLTEYANANNAWRADVPLVGSVHRGEPMVVGLQGNNNLSLRAFFLDRNVVSSRGAGLNAAVAGSVDIAVGGGDPSFIAVTGPADLRTAAIDGDTPTLGRVDTEQLVLTPGGVALGPEGPVFMGIGGMGELGCLPYDPSERDPRRVTGPHPQISAAGGAPGLTSAVVTHTDQGRVVMAWIDGQGDVRYAESPCR